MTISRHVPVRAPGCTCVHADNLHDRDLGENLRGCRVGWSGAGEPVPGMDSGRGFYPSGCPCTATGPAAATAPVARGGVVPPGGPVYVGEAKP